MASPALLLLLLMSSSFCLSIMAVGPPPGQDQLEEFTPQKANKAKEDLKVINKWLQNNMEKIRSAVVPFLDLIPMAGPFVAAIVNALLLLVPAGSTVLDTLQSELENLNRKLDTLQVEMTWDVWAAGAYREPENNIEKGWIKFIELVRSCRQTDDAVKRGELIDEFITFYSKYDDSVLTLQQFLTAKPISITKNLADLLADKLRCHEEDMATFFLYLNQLIWKGNILTQIYYELKGTNTQAKADTAAEAAYSSALALVKSHQNCISHNAAYIEKDVFDQIDDTKKHSVIAKDIRLYLTQTYPRYDWMTVAFTTKNSKQNTRHLTNHFLSGFIEVERGTVTVAVARQLKGTHTKAVDVGKSIENCFHKKIKCHDVIDTLSQCEETVSGIELSQTYTAVHAFRKKSQDDHNAKEAPDNNDDLTESSSDPEAYTPQSPFIYKGSCKRLTKQGHFIVLIKSDEEMTKVNPCSKLNCGPNGDCVVLPGTSIAMCDCHDSYYGKLCENSFKDYKRNLLTDNNVRMIRTESGYMLFNSVRRPRS